jgi:hypothetical protein
MRLKKLKSLSPVLISVIIALGLSVAIQSLFAWTAPTAVPPSSNVAAPLNVSGDWQAKAGALSINTNGINPYGLIVENGNVGIGITNPASKLSIKGSAGGGALNITDSADVHLMSVDSGGRFRIGEFNSSWASSLFDTGSVPNGLVIAGNNKDMAIVSAGSESGKADIDFFKAGGSISAPTNITSTTILGQINWHGYQDNLSLADSGGYLPFTNRLASVAAKMDGTPSNSSLPTRLEFNVTKINEKTSEGSSPEMVIKNNGYVGIGTANPNQQLEITKNFRLPATTGATPYGIIYKDGDPFIHNFNYGNNGTVTTNGENTFVGVSAGNLTMGSTATDSDESSFNTGIGWGALLNNTKGHDNTAVGNSALEDNTTGFFNTSLGVIALSNNTTGDTNTGIGVSALEYNTTGKENTAVGAEALWNTTGNYNTAVGVAALSTNTTGIGNTAIGYNAQTSTNNLTNATAIGYNATVNESNKVVIGNSSVTSIGGYTEWSNYSDLRAKTDIHNLGYGLNFIKQLKPMSFKMKGGNGNINFGFVAQDIEALLGEKYNVLDIGGGDERMLSLRYSQFIAPIVKAMQEQQTQIEEQNEIISGQQEQINELKTIIGKK